MEPTSDVQQPARPRAEPTLPAEELVFLTGAPNEVAALASKHGDKFRSGGVQAPPDDRLFTEPGLHPGSPPAQRTSAASWPAAKAQQAAAAGDGGGAGAVATRQIGGGGGTGGSGAPAAEEDGSDDNGFVFGQVAECLDFSSEEMDAE